MKYTANFEIDNKSYRILQQRNFNSKYKKEAIYEIINYAKKFSQDYSSTRNVRDIFLKLFMSSLDQLV